MPADDLEAQRQLATFVSELPEPTRTVVYLRYFEGLDATAATWLTEWAGDERSAITVDHLMASSAIPFVFPARQITVHGKGEWCGDGSMRQLAPISPAIHLGARRVFVIGTNYQDETHPGARDLSPPYPNLAQIAGHTLSNIFLDGVSLDMIDIASYQAPTSALPKFGLSASTSVLTIMMSMISPGIWLELKTSCASGVLRISDRSGFHVTTDVTAAVWNAAIMSASDVFTTVRSRSLAPIESSARARRSDVDEGIGVDAAAAATPAPRGAAASRRGSLSFSSRRRRSAVFLPMPEMLVSLPSSFRAIA